MRQVILVTAAGAVIALAVIRYAERNAPQPVPAPQVTNSVGAHGSAFCVSDAQYTFVVSLPDGWSKVKHSSSSGGATYAAEAEWMDRRTKARFAAKRSSSSPGIVTIDGRDYALKDGSVFRIHLAPTPDPAAGTLAALMRKLQGQEGDSPTAKAEVIQLPFAPLHTNAHLADELEDYFQKAM